MENLTFSLPLEQMSADIRFDYFNAAKVVKPSSFSFHSHTVFEVYFIESGEMDVCLEETTISLHSHDILILTPHALHRVKHCSDNLRRFNFRFLLHAEILTPVPYCMYEPSNKIKQELFDSVQKIYQHMPQIDQGWAFFRIKSYFGIIISHLIEALLPSTSREDAALRLSSTPKSKIDQQIQIDRFFSENYSRPVTVESLAEELHYSKTHVNRLLQQDFGMSFSEKLDQTRLQAAKQLLRETNETIHVVGERCGYSTLRGFGLFFKKHTGMLPREYRKEHRS